MMALAYYLLKVVICSGILFIYYYAALRNKIFHQWNRFYLLAAVLLSLVAPRVQINIVHHSAEESNKAIQLLQVIQGNDYLDEVVISSQPDFSAAQWMAMLYAMISFIFFISVIISFIKIFSIIKSHTVQWLQNIKFINTTIEGTPFSFFYFIFWNKKIDLQSETGRQIFQHELVHVKEKHTHDKVFMQILLIAFWCNPFFWLIRRELKIIHEFIADKKAVGEQGAAALAAMILSSSYPSHFNSLTNQFFQTSIKRRLAMLTKIQNPKVNYFSRILALPIIATTVLAFTLRAKTATTPIFKSDKQITVVIDAGHGLMPDGKYNGAREGAIYEDQVVLSIAKKIQQLNANKNLKIILTRNTDASVDLHKRVEIAKENNADLFISLHLNAAPGSYKDSAGMKGMQVMVSNKNTPYQKESELLGSVLQEQLNQVHYVKPSLIKRQVGVWVLDQNVCPSVLIECGFLTDKEDKAFITKEKNQEAVAEKILAAIGQYENQNLNENSSADTLPKNQKNKTDLKSAKSHSAIPTYANSSPLILVDGKELTKKELDQIDPATIETVSVFKGSLAMTKYGNKAKDGAIEIHLKNERMSEDTLPKKEAIFTKAEIEASVDKTEWKNYLSKKLQPAIEAAASEGIQPGHYTINVRFIVWKDGTVSDVQALNNPGFNLGDSAVAVVRTGPKWMPAIQNGKSVNSYHTQPITFVIQEQ